MAETEAFEITPMKPGPQRGRNRARRWQARDFGEAYILRPFVAPPARSRLAPSAAFLTQQPQRQSVWASDSACATAKARRKGASASAPRPRLR